MNHERSRGEIQAYPERRRTSLVGADSPDSSEGGDLIIDLGDAPLQGPSTGSDEHLAVPADLGENELITRLDLWFEFNILICSYQDGEGDGSSFPCGQVVSVATEGPKESAVQKDTSDVVSSALTLVPAEGELLF